MPRRSSFIPLLRFGAGFLMGVAVVAFALQFMRTEAPRVHEAANAVLMLVVAIGVGLAMIAIASMLGRDPDEASSENSRALMRVQSQLNELTAKVIQLDESADRIARAQENAITQAPPPLTLTPSDLEPVYVALREIRELTLLPDADRKERLERYRTEKRAAQIKRAFDLVASRQWHEAERLVLALETEFPNDDEIFKARNYLNHARKLHEDETVARTVREVEDLIANAAWDPALQKARALVEGFPDNGQARAIMLRVQRERDAYHESTVARMFDELVHDIDRRMWRRALVHAQGLLQRFPTHPRAEGVRRQLKTIQDNAEIEERQELEVRIQELIRSQRFDDAIALGEDLIRRYPLSPQAESLETLLPRLRDLASQSGPSEPFADLEHEPAMDEDDITHVPTPQQQHS
jgi:hypothetical protein